MQHLKANIQFSQEEAASLRALAASLEIFIQRGVGTGNVGNIRELMQEIANAYKADPVAVEACMRQIMQINHDQAVKDVDEMIARDGAIIM